MTHAAPPHVLNSNTYHVLAENTERDHAAPHSSRQSSVKQIAREKRFCHELFLPLLNAKLKPEMIDFIKEEITMQLNIKVY